MADGGTLSTHVLNTALGIPAAGVRVELHRLEPDPAPVCEARTTADGRTDAILLPAAEFRPGRYELRFHMGEYFRGLGLGAEPAYLDVVPVRIHLAAGQGHYHVPLLCSPWSYTTYRGS